MTADIQIEKISSEQRAYASIGKLISQPWAVKHDISLTELADALLEKKEIEAVALIKESKFRGYISRKDLTDLMSRPFGREVLRNKNLSEVVQKCRIFSSHQSPLEIWKQEDLTEQTQDEWFAVNDSRGNYLGLFFNRDLLVHLSSQSLRDISYARQIQERLQQRKLNLNDGRITLGSLSLPARGVGGDLIFCRRKENRYFFALCDVSGKGMGASLITGMIQGMLEIAWDKRDLTSLARHISRALFECFEGEMFATAVLGDADLTTGNVNLVDLGHSYLYRYAEEALIRIETEDSTAPLGVMPHISPVPYGFTLKEQEYLLVMSDGVLEQESREGAAYEELRMQRLLRQFRYSPMDSLLRKFRKDFSIFHDGEVQKDDVSLLLLRG